MPVVYVLTNTINGKHYVGVTINFEKRLGEHSRKNKNKKHLPICRAIQKYGWKNFRAEILAESSDYSFAVNILEPYYISLFKSNNRDFGYNCTLGGEGALGFRHTESAKINMRNQRLGKKLSEEHCRRISLGATGRKNTPKTIEKMRESARRRWQRERNNKTSNMEL